MSGRAHASTPHPPPATLVEATDMAESPTKQAGRTEWASQRSHSPFILSAQPTLSQAGGDPQVLGNGYLAIRIKNHWSKKRVLEKEDRLLRLKREMDKDDLTRRVVANTTHLTYARERDAPLAALRGRRHRRSDKDETGRLRVKSGGAARLDGSILVTSESSYIELAHLPVLGKTANEDLRDLICSSLLDAAGYLRNIVPGEARLHKRINDATVGIQSQPRKPKPTTYFNFFFARCGEGADGVLMSSND
ncbi:hypothetical protein B0H11DRAFT_1920509 [Mycena galericulata]|nr:hypothetical protein B0H11DRAFT_1920509 [Mycena galericulata]